MVYQNDNRIERILGSQIFHMNMHLRGLTSVKTCDHRIFLPLHIFKKSQEEYKNTEITKTVYFKQVHYHTLLYSQVHVINFRYDNKLYTGQLEGASFISRIKNNQFVGYRAIFVLSVSPASHIELFSV